VTLIAIWRCESCSYCEPRAFVIVAAPMCPFCRIDSRGDHVTHRGERGWSGRRVSLVEAFRDEPVLVP
jgi:hypothetical protein